MMRPMRSLRALLGSVLFALACSAAGAPRVEAAPGMSWHRSFAQAAAQARREGKLVLVASTKPGCGLCDTFRQRTVPGCARELSDVAVLYLYDILRPEAPQVDRVVRANLPGARLMPLVGFVTPDLRWVGGFWGQRDVGQFAADVRRAAPQRPAPVYAAVPAPPSRALAAAPAPAPRSAPPAGASPSRAAPPSVVRPDVGTALIERAVAPYPSAPSKRTAQPEAVQPEAPEPDDELCPGGICRVPSPFEGLAPSPCEIVPPARAERGAPAPAPEAPERSSSRVLPDGRVLARGVGDCGVPQATAPRVPEALLPPPVARRVEAPTELAPALTVKPRAPLTVYGLPDTEAERRALSTHLSGSPDAFPPSQPAAQRVARPAPTRSAPPYSASPAAAPQSAPASRPGATEPRSLQAAETAAQGGRGGELQHLTGEAGDPRLRDLEVRANRWAQGELDRCVLLCLAGRHEECLSALGRVREQMAGSPAALDALRGVDAVETMRDIRQLSDPQGMLATSLKRNKYDELRGTRWARLFSTQG